MFDSHSPELYHLLKEQPGVAPDRLDELDAEHKATGRPLADVVVERGLMGRTDLLQRVADYAGCDFLPDMPEHIPGEALAAVGGRFARDHGVMPLKADGRSIELLVTDPFDLGALDELAFVLNRGIRPVLADPDGIAAHIDRHFGGEGEQRDPLLRELSTGLPVAGEGSEPAEGDLESMADQRPIIAFVNLVLSQAVRARASDIHFEPFEHDFKIRYRVDGVLYEMAPPPPRLARPIVSRVKVLAGLNIAERRVPQDGRIKVLSGGRTVDLRVSTLPTQFGESVVLRILDQSAVRLELPQLGMPPDVLAGIEETIRRPNGILLVTGPTGSGKTTTLYSALRAISTVDLKILTAEDPVEFEIDGIMQVPINPLIGLTFASALRSFLRQDPDVILVGEIRDLETAQIAVQAALTGHLVLSTLHTNDATGSITRLLDLGVEPFLLASTVEAVLAQRLVRRICPHCRTTSTVTPEQAAALGLLPDVAACRPVFRGRGCPECEQSGYLGRTGIYEWLRLNDPLRELVTQPAPMQVLRAEAVRQGMRTLREDGWRAVSEGLTTVEEVITYTQQTAGIGNRVLA